MELEQLRQFLKVAELENFTRAAESVGLSQSALSRSISRLEEELGQPLFDRQTRRVALTNAGQLLHERARLILQLADDAKAEIHDNGHSGRIRIGAIPTIGPYYLPERLESFQSQFPNAHLIVQEETTSNLLRKVSDGDLDIGVAALPISAKYLKVQTLFDEELLLVTHPTHSLARKKHVDLNDLEKQPFVLLDEAHCLSDNVVSICQQKSFHPITLERASQLAMVLELVSIGHGISLIPKMASMRDHSDTRIYRSLDGRKPKRTIVMITNPYRFQSQLSNRFQESLVSRTPN